MPSDRLTLHFTLAEMECPHCRRLPEGGISQELLERLEALRARIGMPIQVNSGYRCPEHNRAVGGAPKSQHMLGTAADIAVAGMDPPGLYVAAHGAGFRGLFLYNTFVHVDVRPQIAAGDYRTRG